METAHPHLKKLNSIALAVSVVLALALYFTVPAALLTGNEPTVDDVKASLKLNNGWSCQGSPASLFQMHRARMSGGEMGEMREALQLRCYFVKDDEFPQSLTGDDFREPIQQTYHKGLNKALQSAIFDHNLQALSIALYVKGKTVCYFPGVNKWSQCDGESSCLRGACEHRDWLKSETKVY